jgi:hypothetical protein
MLAVRDDLAVGAQDGGHPGLAEHQPGPLIRVVRVHRHVGGADQQDGQDRDVELVGAGRDPYPNFVARSEAGLVQPPAPQPLAAATSWA